MLTIRLRRMGSTKKPYFRVVVTEARSARDSSFVENVGTYYPRSKPAQVNLNKTRIEHWLKKGAKPSDLPIELPTLYELILNKRTVQSLGIAVPPAFAAVVDDLVE